MARLAITGVAHNERAASKMWRHHVTVDQLDEMLRNRYVVNRNRANRAAPYLLIGRDDQGHCLVDPIVPTDDPLIWRPITAWYCKPSEAAKLRQGRSIMEEPTRYVAHQEPLDDEERELMDPDMWDWENPIEGVPTPNPLTILEIRFNHDEIKRLGPLARTEGVTIHEFVKRAALARVPEHANR